jgi:hypothetical protein
VNEQPLSPYAHLVDELRRLCGGRRSGTLFVVTAGNQSGSIGLRDGDIVTARFQLRKGVEALREISGLDAARFTFTEHDAEHADPRAPLPHTPEVLRLLGTTGGTTAVAPSRFPEEELARALGVLVPALTDILGPMAVHIVREHLAGARDEDTDLRKAIEAIAKEIRDPARAAQFKHQVLARLLNRTS